MINKSMRALGERRSVIRELYEYARARAREVGEEGIFDFSLGNPSVSAPDGVGEGLIDLLQSESSLALHGYTSAPGDMGVRRAIAEHLNKTYSEQLSGELIYMTAGCAGALTATLTAITSADDEVIVLTPYFPEYKVFIERCGARTVEVACKPPHFYPDIEAIREAITERTAAIIINSPNNPTGAVYPECVIKELTDMLARKQKKLAHPIYLISDEPYRELVFDGAVAPYLTKYYDNTVVCYSYSKALSIPGERIGYALVCPRAEDALGVYNAICGAGRALGFVCAPSLFQRLIPRVLDTRADIAVYEQNRKILYEALVGYGYEVVKPDGAFYLFVKALESDAMHFSEVAKSFGLILVPSDDFGTPSYVRIAYCTDTDKIRRSLPAFMALMEHYKNLN